jgi:hypothetical protein
MTPHDKGTAGKKCLLCDNAVYARGYCRLHYQRLRIHGDPMHIDVTRNKGQKCKVDGCDQQARFKLLCEKHYQRFRKHGDTSVVLHHKTRSGKQPILYCRFASLGECNAYKAKIAKENKTCSQVVKEALDLYFSPNPHDNP